MLYRITDLGLLFYTRIEAYRVIEQSAVDVVDNQTSQY